MLVIRRKDKETFYIYPEDLPVDMTVAELFSDGNIAVTIKKIRPLEVSLAIQAPQALTIRRDNIKDTIKKKVL